MFRYIYSPKFIILSGFCVSMLVIPASTYAQGDKESIAVLDMEGRGISQIEAQTLTDRMRSELVKTGAVTVVERGQMQTILGEQDFQTAGCTSDECAVEIGQMLGVTMMVTGSIGKIGSTYTLDIRTIDVETGAITNTMTKDFRGEIDGLIKEIEYISWEVVGLVHPDLMLGGLGDEPVIDLAQIRRQQQQPEPVVQPQPVVQQPAPQQPTPQAQPQVRPKQGGGLGNLFGIVFLGALGYGGYWAYENGYLDEILGIEPEPPDIIDGNGNPIGNPPDFPNASLLPKILPKRIF